MASGGSGSAILASCSGDNGFMGFGGLVGDNCKNESAEKCDAEAGGQHDVARRKGGFEFGFGFVGHGFGFGERKKSGCLSSLSTLYEYCGIFTFVYFTFVVGLI